ncbi:MAG: AAA family ATPase, partial [Firmicutes bacterium]|nr:AAA family ATPase [Bacillota bacterium]
NFHTALKTSNLVILSGMSGTGKSRLVEVYGRALGMDTEQLNIISVRPSWTDDADLIGYVDSIHNVYRPGDSGLIDTLRQAEQHADTLYLICFDEMNLARVEHYFSQFLSVLEMPQSRRELRLYNEELMNRLYNYKEYPNSIAIGPNVMFVGTVNMDESTHHFSDKVLDRANLITLHMLPFAELRQSAERRPDRNVRRKWNTEEYSAFRSNVEGIGLSEEELQCLQDIHDLLQQADASRGIGYRIVRQIDLYLKNRPQSIHLTREDAFDLQIVQRVLTKVRGSEDQLHELLGQWQGSAASGSTSGGTLLACLDRHATVSHFVQTRKVIRQKGKELKLHGYTV